MSLGLLMDVHVQAAITSGLRRRQVDVRTAQEEGADTLDDPDLLDLARTLGRLLFTRDDDLLREATRRQRAGETFASVVYAHQLKVSIGQCIEDLEVLAKTSTEGERLGQVFHLPL